MYIEPSMGTAAFGAIAAFIIVALLFGVPAWLTRK